jgi:hypothetical protein
VEKDSDHKIAIEKREKQDDNLNLDTVMKGTDVLFFWKNCVF